MSRGWKMIAAAAALAAVAVTAVLIATRGSLRPDLPYVILLYEVAPEGGESEAAARDRAITGIRMRLDERGIDRPSVTQAGRSRVRVELGGERELIDRMVAMIERSAVLGVHVVDSDHATMRAMAASVRAEAPAGITAADETWAGPDGAPYQDVYLVAADRLKLEAWVRTRPPSERVPDDRRIVHEYIAHEGGTRPAEWRTYVIDETPVISGGDVAKVEVSYDQVTMRPEVLLELQADAARRFGDVTAASIGRKLAIVLDGRVMSAPIVMSRIGGGRVSITMGGADVQQQERDAHDLVAVLKSGSIPPLLLVERRDVGPAR